MEAQARHRGCRVVAPRGHFPFITGAKSNPLEEENAAGSPKAVSDEAEQDYEMFKRADRPQSDDGQQLPQASSDEAGMEPLENMKMSNYRVSMMQVLA